MSQGLLKKSAFISSAIFFQISFLFFSQSFVFANSPAQTGSISPAKSAFTADQPTTITTTCIDLDSWTEVKCVYLLINSALTGYSACYAYYNQNTNLLYLRNDANTAWLGGFSPGSPNIIQNSSAKLNCKTTVISGENTTLTINWNITFTSKFSGTRYAYLCVTDDFNSSSPWVKKADFCVFLSPVAAPAQ